MIERSMVLEPSRFVSGHTAPAAADPDSVGARKDILPARSTQGTGKPGEEGYASQLRAETHGSKAVIEFEGIYEIHGACTRVVGPAVGINVGRKKQLDGVDGVKDDIIEEEDFVELDSVFVDGLEGAVADIGEESDALETFFAVG